MSEHTFTGLNAAVTRRTTLLMGAAAGLAALVPALPAAADDAGDIRPELRIAVQQNPTSQEPVDAASNVAFRNNYSIHETVLAIDMRGDFSVKPNLGTSWTWVSPTILEMKLRPGVIFHDGREMTADDVAFSFGPERLLNKNAPGYPVYLTSFTSLDHVEVVDPLTVRFITKFQDPIFLQRLACYAAVVISRDAWQKNGGNWTTWRQKPIGAGPYKVESYATNENVVLASHDQAFRGKPAAKRVTLRIVPEVSSRIAGLLAGDYDIATDLPPDQLSAVTGSPGHSIVGGPVPNHRILYFDKTNPALKDPRVRQALILAIDRQAIVDSIWDGRTRVPNGLQFELYGPVYLKDYPAYKYDPDQAAKLLKDAGYNGEEIEVRSQNNYYTAENPVTQAVVAMWQAIGVNAKMKFVEGGKLFENAPGRATGNWSSTAQIPDPYISFYTQFGSAGSLNSFKIWQNADFDALGAKMEKAVDPAERAKIFRDMLQLIEWNDPGVTVLHQNAVFYGIRDGIKWQPLPAFQMDLGAGSLSFEEQKS
ncbi:ABC transporter substrate-binding protein [Rhizobium jaguaris]|uniref:Peptide ABC transporter n=1 Tax=Rhizobium jaguaris TaxID=1312183 RepID=A0A387FZV9_9HYPH|nr:ABC transporter substrate-binding protein [Rhizobium jaguaris]AYG63177.1 peptide ABC transporter [Rhizobium jaguaris]